jgi:hypothetical protein
MDWNSQPLDDSRKLAEARHTGWLAGVALRLGVGSLTHNPYEHGSHERLVWDEGFEEGLAD